MSGNLGTEKEKRKVNPISKAETTLPDKTVKMNGVYHKILKIETAQNGGTVKDLVDKAVEEYIQKYLPNSL